MNAQAERLLNAAKLGSLKELKKLVHEQEVDLALENADGKTALFLAIENGHAEVVDYLLNLTNELGSITYSNGKKFSVLELAAYFNQEKVFKVLIDQNTAEPVDIIEKLYHKALCRAAMKDYHGIINIILTTSPHIVNWLDDSGNTALHYAAWQRHEASVNLLLQAKASAEVTNRGGRTATLFMQSKVARESSINCSPAV